MTNVKSIDRREFVVLMGEGVGVRKQKMLPIIRSGNGKFFGFGEYEMPDMDKVEGRFAQMLPAKPVTPENRMMAKAMLEVKGVGGEKKRKSKLKVKRF